MWEEEERERPGAENIGLLVRQEDELFLVTGGQDPRPHAVSFPLPALVTPRWWERAYVAFARALRGVRLFTYPNNGYLNIGFNDEKKGLNIMLYTSIAAGEGAASRKDQHVSIDLAFDRPDFFGLPANVVLNMDDTESAEDGGPWWVTIHEGGDFSPVAERKNIFQVTPNYLPLYILSNIVANNITVATMDGKLTRDQLLGRIDAQEGLRGVPFIWGDGDKNMLIEIKNRNMDFFTHPNDLRVKLAFKLRYPRAKK